MPRQRSLTCLLDARAWPRDAVPGEPSSRRRRSVGAHLLRGAIWPWPDRQHRRRRALLAAFALTLGASGCTSDEPPASRPTATASATRTPSPTEAPAEPTPTRPTDAGAAPGSPDASVPGSEPTVTASPSAAGGTARGGTGLTERLLPAAELPGFNQAFTWREQGTSGREPADLATCNRFAFMSLGATRTVTRTYGPAGEPGPVARHLVAQFPDEATAARAYDVLTAWRRQCPARLARYDLRRVGQLTAVAVSSGTAGWYLLTYGPVRRDADDAVFESTGTAIAGTRVAVVDMRLVGQDFNYPAGREPMVTAVQRAAGLLS
jgi:hypothetical protein